MCFCIKKTLKDSSLYQAITVTGDELRFDNFVKKTKHDGIQNDETYLSLICFLLSRSTKNGNPFVILLFVA